MNPLSKLQSEAVLEFDKQFLHTGDMIASIDGYEEELKQFISDQIQKAYYLGIQLGYTKHLKEELLLSIQSKGKIK